jgi:CRP-like cAMP-binding protein
MSLEALGALFATPAAPTYHRPTRSPVEGGENGSAAPAGFAAPAVQARRFSRSRTLAQPRRGSKPDAQLAGQVPAGSALEQLARALGRTPLFSSCSMGELRAICSEAQFRSYARFHVLYREGSMAGWMAVLLAGGVEIVDYHGSIERHERQSDATALAISPSATAAAAASFPLTIGEEGCADQPLPRFGTARTFTDSTVCMLLPRAAVPPALRLHILRAVVARLLRQMQTLFCAVDDAKLAKLAALFRLQCAAHGDAVVTQGERADSLFLLVSGKLAVTVKSAWDEPVIVGEIAAHSSLSFFGESSIVAEGSDSGPAPVRNATLTAAEACWLLRLDSHHFALFLQHLPDIQERFRDVRPRDRPSLALRNRHVRPLLLTATPARPIYARGRAPPLAPQMRMALQAKNRRKKHDANRAKLFRALDYIQASTPAVRAAVFKTNGFKARLMDALERNKRAMEADALALRASIILNGGEQSSDDDGGKGGGR